MTLLKYLMIGMAWLCALWAVPVYATIDWDDSFEYTSNLTMVVPTGPYDSSCPNTHVGVSDPVTGNPHSGLRSLHLTYPPPDSEGGCSKNRGHTATDVLYQRWWMYVSPGWLGIPDIATKIISNGPSSLYPSIWWTMTAFGSASAPLTFGGTPQGIYVSPDVYTTVNVYGGTIPRGVYTCVETEMRFNTPGIPNGVLRAWINNTQVINQTNVNWRGPVLAPVCLGCGNNSPTAQMQTMAFYRQHGNGFIDYDDYAISRDARIGCSGTPQPPDTTPPTTPSVVTATPGVAQMTVTWSASIDTESGLGGYHILRCTNPGCTGATPLADVGPFTTTLLDAPLADNTTYGYQIVAFDLAAPVNQSPASTIVYGTTASGSDTTPPPIPVAPAVPSVGLPATYTWQAVINPGDLAGYNVYRKTEACIGPNPTILIATLGNILTYQDTTIPLTTASICVQIASRDSTGNVSARSTGIDEILTVVDSLAHVTGIVTDKNGASLTFTGLAYSVRFWTDTIPVTIINGLGGVTTYRHSIDWPHALTPPETTFACYAAMDVNGTWENDVNAASYQCNSIDLIPPPPLGGIEISRAVPHE